MDSIRKLVSARLRAQARAAHPDADLLSAFAENSLARAQRNQVIAHLSDCQDCREVLYLSLPEGDKAQTVLVLDRGRGRLFRLRWASVIAGIVIAGAVFTSRYQLLPTHNRPSGATRPEAVATYAKVMEEKQASSESDQSRAPAATKKAGTLKADNKVLPEFKAMHAKPAASLNFDQSGQVHMREPAPRGGPIAGSLSRSKAALPGVAGVPPAEDSRRIDLEEAAEADRSDRFQTNQLSDQPAAPTKVRIAAAASSPAEKEEARSVTVKDHTVTTSFRRQQVSSPGGAPMFQWTLSAEGTVLRSLDQGKTWQTVSPPKNGPFAALSSVATHVWIGGKGGTLYHSADSGETWHEVVPARADRRLATDVTHIEFSDPLNGVVTTSEGESWSTSDGGLSWRHD